MELYSEKQFEDGEHPHVELLAAHRAKVLVGDMDENILYHVLSCDECLEIYSQISTNNFDLFEIEQEMEKERFRISAEFKDAIKKFQQKREIWEDVMPFLLHIL